MKKVLKNGQSGAIYVESAIIGALLVAIFALISVWLIQVANERSTISSNVTSRGVQCLPGQDCF